MRDIPRGSYLERPPGVPSSAVLVFDPDPLSSAGLADLLALVGRRAIRAASDDDVLAALQTQAVPLLLLTVDSDGEALSLLRRIRADERRRDQRPTAAIAITDLAGEGHRLECLLAGFAECLPRPVQHAALAGAIASACDDDGNRDRIPETGSDFDRIRTVARRLAGARDDNGFSPSAIEAIALQLDRHLDGLGAEAAAADPHGIAEAANQILAICDLLGARHLTHVTRRIDEAAAAGKWDRVAALVDEARSAHEAVIGLLFESMSG